MSLARLAAMNAHDGLCGDDLTDKNPVGVSRSGLLIGEKVRDFRTCASLNAMAELAPTYQVCPCFVEANSDGLFHLAVGTCVCQIVGASPIRTAASHDISRLFRLVGK